MVCLDRPYRPTQLRDLYAAADVLVVPSIPTRTFREPWGLVVNEAMNRELPVIASDAVGAAAGGLVRDGHNGLVVPAGDARALAGAIRRLAADAPLRARLGAAGSADVQAYTHDAWAQGFSRALRSLGLSRGSAGSVRRLFDADVPTSAGAAARADAGACPRGCAGARVARRPPRRSASEATKIYEALQQRQVPSGYSQQAYSQAMKEMNPTSPSTPPAPT